MKRHPAMVFGIGAALGALLAYFWPKPKPYRVLAIVPSACKRAGNCAQGDSQWQLATLGSFMTAEEAVSASMSPCPPNTEVRVIVGPVPGGMPDHVATLAAIVPRNDGTCYPSVSLAADVAASAQARGLRLPPAVMVA